MTTAGERNAKDNSAREEAVQIGGSPDPGSASQVARACACVTLRHRLLELPGSGKRISGLRARKQKIFDAFIEAQIEKEVYDTQTAAVQTQIDEAETLLPIDADGEQELFRLLDFAEWDLYAVGTLWYGADATRKARIQSASFQME